VGPGFRRDDGFSYRKWICSCGVDCKISRV
jgi:hypothetical protein